MCAPTTALPTRLSCSARTRGHPRSCSCPLVHERDRVRARAQKGSMAPWWSLPNHSTRQCHIERKSAIWLTKMVTRVVHEYHAHTHWQSFTYVHIRDMEREKEKEKGFTAKTNGRSEFERCIRDTTRWRTMGKGAGSKRRSAHRRDVNRISYAPDINVTYVSTLQFVTSFICNRKYERRYLIYRIYYYTTGKLNSNDFEYAIKWFFQHTIIKWLKFCYRIDI